MVPQYWSLEAVGCTSRRGDDVSLSSHLEGVEDRWPLSLLYRFCPSVWASIPKAIDRHPPALLVLRVLHKHGRNFRAVFLQLSGSQSHLPFANRHVSIPGLVGGFYLPDATPTAFNRYHTTEFSTWYETGHNFIYKEHGEWKAKVGAIYYALSMSAAERFGCGFSYRDQALEIKQNSMIVNEWTEQNHQLNGSWRLLTIFFSTILGIVLLTRLVR